MVDSESRVIAQAMSLYSESTPGSQSRLQGISIHNRQCIQQCEVGIYADLLVFLLCHESSGSVARASSSWKVLGSIPMQLDPCGFSFSFSKACTVSFLSPYPWCPVLQHVKLLWCKDVILDYTVIKFWCGNVNIVVLCEQVVRMIFKSNFHHASAMF